MGNLRCRREQHHRFWWNLQCLIDKSSFTVDDEWEATASTSDAIVEVVDDIAYIGLTGIGVARWDIANSEWLSTWTEDNVLDNGNEIVTSLIADIRPGYIWVGGRDGFQLIGTANGTEFYDIEKSNSLYSGNGDPFDLTMYGYTMYYHQGTSSDSIYGIDVANFTSITPLDAGQRVGENGGCLLYTSPSPRDNRTSRMPSSA